jgi:pimeloyl-ACP methyl ester carboxylesterase
LALQRTLSRQAQVAAPFAESILASPAGRRRATALLTESFEHIPTELLIHQLLGVANCAAAETMIDYGLREQWRIQPDRITCPVRVIWGSRDRLLPWPRAAARYRTDWLPHADWVVLDGVGHYPQLDVPSETAELITGFTTLFAEPGPRPSTEGSGRLNCPEP